MDTTHEYHAYIPQPSIICELEDEVGILSSLFGLAYPPPPKKYSQKSFNLEIRSHSINTYILSSLSRVIKRPTGLYNTDLQMGGIFHPAQVSDWPPQFLSPQGHSVRRQAHNYPQPGRGNNARSSDISVSIIP